MTVKRGWLAALVGLLFASAALAGTPWEWVPPQGKIYKKEARYLQHTEWEQYTWTYWEKHETPHGWMTRVYERA